MARNRSTPIEVEFYPGDGDVEYFITPSDGLAAYNDIGRNVIYTKDRGGGFGYFMPTARPKVNGTGKGYWHGGNRTFQNRSEEP